MRRQSHLSMGDIERRKREKGQKGERKRGKEREIKGEPKHQNTGLDPT